MLVSVPHKTTFSTVHGFLLVSVPKIRPMKTTETRKRDFFVLNAELPQQKLMAIRFEVFYDSQSPKTSKNVRAARSDFAFVQPTGDPKRILRDQDLSCRTKYNHQKLESADKIERELTRTLDQALSSPNRKGALLSSTSQGQYGFAAFIPDVETSPQL